ncbi:uncharacterized protein LOC114943644 isoform X3 [Nylanderia fulva]|uniref:uncharacterized protein LOC114943644 isoform X3 n=1 Tax=Nylanderia fulva TaxID=613905 RepID=UPI0010FBA55C|nr:uncharacterized protein LOC114943644 isoform X3 [Nylanderia fulva]
MLFVSKYKERVSVIINMAMILNDLFDSSDHEENNMLFPFQPIMRNDDDDFYELHMLHPIFGLVQRIEHVKINNYIEHIVHNYNNVDFIMHFRLSRRAAYQLIDQFTVSEIFTSIQALAPNIIKYPTDLEKEQTSNFYLQQKRFPNIIGEYIIIIEIFLGAIDGSQIRIDKPLEDPDSYINRKQYFSIQVQGTVNHDMKGGVSIRPFFGPRQNRSKLWYFLPTNVAHNLLEPFAVRAIRV